MKTIIIEGIDNLGKSTVTAALAQNYEKKYNVVIVHSTVSTDFTHLAKGLVTIAQTEDVEGCTQGKETLVLLDRSWLDEYVYAPIYRNKDKSEVMRLIYSITDILFQYPNFRSNLYEVLLTASPSFAIFHDDKKSFYSDMEKEDKVKRIIEESDKFNEIININPHFVDYNHIAVVNVEDENCTFRDNIVEEIINKFNL